MFLRYSSEEFVSATAQTTELIPTTFDGGNTICYATLIPDLLIVIIGLVGMAGNGVVISLLGCCMRRNAISVYILNLATADFLFLCCHFIRSLLFICCDLHYGIFIYVALIPYITSLSILSAISIERYLCVLWPIWYRCHRPRHMSAAMCALLWTLSLLFSLVECYYSGIFNEISGSDNLKNVDFIVVAWLIFLLITLCLSSLALGFRILCGSRWMPVTRLYVTILLTVLIFLICGLPFGIYWYLLFWLPVNLNNFLCRPNSVPIAVSCINSCANPIIYYLIGSFRQQHKSLKLALQSALQD